jgi:hypothetical protein
MARRCSHNCEFSRLGVFVACAAHLPHLNPNPESHERDLCISWVDRALLGDSTTSLAPTPGRHAP